MLLPFHVYWFLNEYFLELVIGMDPFFFTTLLGISLYPSQKNYIIFIENLLEEEYLLHIFSSKIGRNYQKDEIMEQTL